MKSLFLKIAFYILVSINGQTPTKENYFSKTIDFKNFKLPSKETFFSSNKDILIQNQEIGLYKDEIQPILTKSNPENSLLNSRKKTNYFSTKNIELKYDYRPLEKRIDYNDLMLNCGLGFQNKNSGEVMFSAIKNYILNKYVFSLFTNTEYD